MRGGIRGAVVAVLATAALVLGGCAGLPVDGAVQPGLEAAAPDEAPEFSFRPPPPPDGATPTQIVDGFLAAGSGPASGWAVAREYLADDIRETWQPSANVTVAVTGTLETAEVAAGEVRTTLRSAARVDGSGTYELSQESATTLSFSLAQQDDGEWRITTVPDGIVLDEDIFPAVFRSYELVYWDRTFTYLVPDVRWFPRTNTATLIADALIDKQPPSWLAGAVFSAFPDEIELARQAVPVESGVAQVELGAAALNLDRETQARMQTQLDVSMASAGIARVQMSVSGTPLDSGTAPARSTDVATQALVLDGSGFGFVSGGALVPVEGLDAAITRLLPDAIQTSADLSEAAVRLPTGAAARVRSDDEVLVADERPGLVAPGLDPFGWLWSVPTGDPGGLLAAPPTGGDPVAVAGAWPGAGEISALRVARDGTRVAALVSSGGRAEVWVSGIVRGEDGAPVSLGEPYPVAALEGAGVALDWLDPTTLGILSSQDDGTVLRVQTVGGDGQTLDAPAGSVQIAGANQPATVRVRDADGVLYSRRGSTWGVSLTGVVVLAAQLGRSG